jgi:hypothetical protein
MIYSVYQGQSELAIRRIYFYEKADSVRRILKTSPQAKAERVVAVLGTTATDDLGARHARLEAPEAHLGKPIRWADIA